MRKVKISYVVAIAAVAGLQPTSIVASSVAVISVFSDCGEIAFWLTFGAAVFSRLCARRSDVRTSGPTLGDLRSRRDRRS